MNGFYVVAGDDRPVIVHTCANKRQQKYIYKKRLKSNVWRRVEMVAGDYSLVDLSYNWEVCDEAKLHDAE